MLLLIDCGCFSNNLTITQQLTLQCIINYDFTSSFISLHFLQDLLNLSYFFLPQQA